MTIKCDVLLTIQEISIYNDEGCLSMSTFFSALQICKLFYSKAADEGAEELDNLHSKMKAKKKGECRDKDGVCAY